MNTEAKKRIHHIWHFFRLVRPVYLGIVLVVLLTVTVLALRANNLEMAERRQAVYVADKKNGDVEGALRHLREYVHSHMNTSLSSGQSSVYPPLQLKYTYERLLAEENERARKQNQSIYTEAQAHCEALYPESVSGGPRVPCIREYVTDHGVKVTSIPDSLYKFDFIAPRWSADVAGFSVIATGIVAVLFALRVLAGPILRRLDVL